MMRLAGSIALRQTGGILHLKGARTDRSGEIVTKLGLSAQLWHGKLLDVKLLVISGITAEGTMFPVVLTGEFDLDIPYGNWTWQTAEVVSDETINKESSIAFLHELQKCLTDKNFFELEPHLRRPIILMSMNDFMIRKVFSLKSFSEIRSGEYDL